MLTARSEEKLRALAAELGPDVAVAPGDVTDAADVQRIVQATLARFGRIDGLMANAGIYIPGNFDEGEPDAFAHLIDVNINGVLRFAHAVLPTMLAQGSGDVMVTGSISGFVDVHWEPVYSASKHAVLAWAHGVRRQVMGKGVRVMTLAPGMVANELWGIYDADAIAEHVHRRSALTSEDVAEAAIYMFERPAHVTVRDLVLVPQNQDI